MVVAKPACLPYTVLTPTGKDPTMNAQITTDDILAKAFDIIEAAGFRTYSAEEMAAVKAQALEELMAEDEGNLTNAKRAIDCAQLRDFLGSQPGHLAADYAKHGNAWPFSGDHLNTHDVRQEIYIEGYGWESGDVIGRERRVFGPVVSVWELVAA
ncbi:hypothetical protein SEA_KARATE_14 [Microbacterium phage Karate]|nr:hypothetical protein SEA_KARATE_14 [Microbacterium phage Karate]